MFQFRRYFFLSALVAFVVIAVLLGIFVRQMVRSNLLELAEDKNVALTQAFSNSLWPAFAPLVEDSPMLTTEQLQNDPRVPELYQLVKSQLTDLSIVKIKVYNLEGLTVFSSEMSQIGETVLENAGYQSARQGETSSELVHRDSFSAFEQTISDRDVFASYVPIFADGSSGQVVGVFEIYDDVTSLVERTNQVQWIAMVGVVLLLSLLFSFLTVIGQRTFNIIQRQYENIRRSEQILKQSEKKFSNLFQQSGDGIFLLDWDGRIRDINPRIIQMLGYSRDELLKMTIDELHPDDSVERMKKRTAQLLTEGLAQFEIDFKTKDGDLIPAEVSVTMSDLGGKRVLQGMVRDIRARKRQESALREAHEAALTASRMKTQLLANVSHDLRTPLNAILGYSEMLQAEVFGELTTKQREGIAQIIDSTGHLLNFVNNLLDQAHIEGGQLKLNPQPFAVADLVTEVEVLVRVLAEAKGLSLQSVIAPEMPAQIIGDRYWLRQIMTNLISNSIKFSDAGTVDIQIYPVETAEWIIKVSDGGIGMPEEALELIFQPFWQVPGDNVRLGSGVGLAIVNQLTNMMQGSVEVSSVVGQGSTFIVRLPLIPVTELVQ